MTIEQDIAQFNRLNLLFNRQSKRLSMRNREWMAAVETARELARSGSSRFEEANSFQLELLAKAERTEARDGRLRARVLAYLNK